MVWCPPSLGEEHAHVRSFSPDGVQQGRSQEASIKPGRLIERG